MEMEKRSPVKIMERRHEEATEALHAGRESCHPKEASAGAGADLEIAMITSVAFFFLFLVLWELYPTVYRLHQRRTSNRSKN
jgi:hypothetical protein